MTRQKWMGGSFYKMRILKAEGNMSNLKVIEDDIREIAELAAKTLGMLTAPEEAPSPARYQAIMRSLERLREKWNRHGRLQNGLFPMTVIADARFYQYFDQFQRGHVAVEE